MILDIHTHIFPDELAPRALDKLVGNSGLSTFTDATVAGLVASMRSAGVDRSAIMPIATKPSQVRGINQWAVDVREKYPEIIGFGTLHPKQDNWDEDIEFLKRENIPGIKLHPDYQAFFVDAPEVLPMYQRLAEAGLIVMFHAGVDIGLPPPVHCTPIRTARMLDAVPDLKVIAAHMGGYACWDDVERHLIGRDLYLDTSFSMADLGTERMAAMISAHGVDRVLFGTDSPWTDQAAEVKHVQTLPFREDEIDGILGNNAARLLHIQA